jgi:outer membrane autotransporter protein
MSNDYCVIRPAMMCVRLMASTALGLGLSALMAQPATAACTATSAAVVCGLTSTADTTNAGASPASDRHYIVDTSASPFTGSVSSGAVVSGSGLAFTETAGGGGSLSVANEGGIVIDAGSTAFQGGSAALQINTSGATPTIYSGSGALTNLGTGGNALTILSSGSGAITANVGGDMTAAQAGDAVAVFKVVGAAGGDINVTTASGSVFRSGFVGVRVEAHDVAHTGNLTVANNAAIYNLVGAPNTLEYGVEVGTAGLGAVAISNTGTLGSAGELIQIYGLFGSIINSASTADLTVANGSGSIFANNGILARSQGTGTITVTTGTGSINAVTSGIRVFADGLNMSNVTTGSGAVIASDSGGIGIDVLGGDGATFITTGGTISGGTDGIRARTRSTQDFAVDGVTAGSAGAGILSDTAANRSVLIGLNGNVTGGTAAILLASTGGATVTNSGSVGGSPSGLALDAASAGATALTNQSSGSINGRITLGGAADTFSNAGVFTTQGNNDFGAGSDTFTNAASGTITLAGATAFANLESFTQNGRINLNAFTLSGSGDFINAGTLDTGGNAGLAGFTALSNSETLDLAAGTFTAPPGVFTNSGTILADEGASRITGQSDFVNTGVIDLQEGAVGDTLTINSSFSASGSSALLIDYGGSSADTLVITGTASGSTIVDVRYAGGGLIDVDGILVVDSSSSTADAFVLGNVGGSASPLVDYSLVQNGADFFLIAAPTEPLLEPLAVFGLVRTLWHQSADEVIAQTRLRGDTEGTRVWAHVYAGKDSHDDRADVQSIDGAQFGTEFDIETSRFGLQGGVDFGLRGGRVGLTAGYARAKAEENGNGDSVIPELKGNGWNIGVYGQYGSSAGVHAEFLAKHDRFDMDFETGTFEGVSGNVRSTGLNGSVGYRLDIGGRAMLDASAGLSHVRTKIEDIGAFGFAWDMRTLKSTRGRAGLRATFAGRMAPYAGAAVHHEFDGDGKISLFDGGENFELRADGRTTWLRLDGGIAPNPAGLTLAAWADLGDRRGFGLRAGYRFGGKR